MGTARTLDSALGDLSCYYAIFYLLAYLAQIHQHKRPSG